MSLALGFRVVRHYDDYKEKIGEAFSTLANVEIHLFVVVVAQFVLLNSYFVRGSNPLLLEEHILYSCLPAGVAMWRSHPLVGLVTI